MTIKCATEIRAGDRLVSRALGGTWAIVQSVETQEPLFPGDEPILYFTVYDQSTGERVVLLHAPSDKIEIAEFRCSACGSKHGVDLVTPHPGADPEWVCGACAVRLVGSES